MPGFGPRSLSVLAYLYSIDAKAADACAKTMFLLPRNDSHMSRLKYGCPTDINPYQRARLIISAFYATVNGYEFDPLEPYNMVAVKTYAAVHEDILPLREFELRAKD